MQLDLTLEDIESFVPFKFQQQLLESIEQSNNSPYVIFNNLRYIIILFTK